jgi:ABC-2 type transport system permease protein
MQLASSISRWWAIVWKELLQLKRDRLTLAMIILIPIMQLVLFGYAINTNPKHLPTAIVSADNSILVRSFIASMKTSSYFELNEKILTKAEAKQALERGKVLFVIHFPVDFTRSVLRGENPEVLLEADATDNTAIAGPTAVIKEMLNNVFQEDFRGVLSKFNNTTTPYKINIHLLYNPEQLTQYNIIPGLIGTILTFTLVMMTAIAITRERERGTMEQLLAMPVKSYEVITGKIVPYMIIGLVQATIIVVAARYIFNVPIFGGLFILYIVILLFIIGNIAIGVTFSSLAKNQMQSMQMTQMMLLPSIFLSGYIFPFAGMPLWAQYIGQVIPLTYFIRLTRAIMLKDSSFVNLWPNIWPLLLIDIIIVVIGVTSYRKTLD